MIQSGELPLICDLYADSEGFVLHVILDTYGALSNFYGSLLRDLGSPDLSSMEGGGREVP